jgi:hypothetical protein
MSEKIWLFLTRPERTWYARAFFLITCGAFMVMADWVGRLQIVRMGIGFSLAIWIFNWLGEQGASKETPKFIHPVSQVGQLLQSYLRQH